MEEFVVNYNELKNFYNNFKFNNFDSRENEINRLYFNMLKSEINYDFYNIFEDFVKYSQKDYLFHFFECSKKTNEFLIGNKIDYSQIKNIFKEFATYKNKERIRTNYKRFLFTSNKIIKNKLRNHEEIFSFYKKNFKKESTSKYFTAINKTINFSIENEFTLDFTNNLLEILKYQIEENKKNIFKNNLEEILNKNNFDKYMEVLKEYILYIDYKKINLEEIYSTF